MKIDVLPGLVNWRRPRNHSSALSTRPGLKLEKKKAGNRFGHDWHMLLKNQQRKRMNSLSSRCGLFCFDQTLCWFFLRLLPQNSFNDVAEMLQNLSLKSFFWRSVGTLEYSTARTFFKSRYIKTWVLHIMRSEVGQTETEKAYQKILKCRYVTPSVISLFKKCSKIQR